MPNSTERYLPITEILPKIMPKVTHEEALRAANRIFEHFTKRADRYRRARRVWISSRLRTNHSNKGWARIVHDVSHNIFGHIYPSRRDHDPLHAHYEIEVAKYVVEKGWLDGRLRPKPKAPPAPKPKPTSSDKLAVVEASMRRWETKAKRAATALKKLRRRRAALMRHASASCYIPPASFQQQQAEEQLRIS
jgi:hypothetical protein